MSKSQLVLLRALNSSKDTQEKSLLNLGSRDVFLYCALQLFKMKFMPHLCPPHCLPMTLQPQEQFQCD